MFIKSNSKGGSIMFFLIFFSKDDTSDVHVKFHFHFELRSTHGHPLPVRLAHRVQSHLPADSPKVFESCSVCLTKSVFLVWTREKMVNGPHQMELKRCWKRSRILSLVHQFTLSDIHSLMAAELPSKVLTCPSGATQGLLRLVDERLHLLRQSLFLTGRC